MNKQSMFPRVLITILFTLVVSVGCGQEATNINSLLDHHATIETTDWINGEAQTTLKEEWFKQPHFLRREVSTPGQLKKVFIYDGSDSLAYFPTSSIPFAFREAFDLHPTFYAPSVSPQLTECLQQHGKLDLPTEAIDGKETYVYQERTQLHNGKGEMLTAWFDTATLSVLRLQTVIYNSEGCRVREEVCKNIEYALELTDDLFRLPPGFKITEGSLPKLEPITPKEATTNMEISPELLRRLSQERERLRNIINDNRANADTYAQLGNLLIATGEFEEAIRLLEKSIGLDPKQKLAYSTLVEVYRVRGDISEAIKWQKKKEPLCRNNSFRALYYYDLGQLYEEAGLIQDATSAYERAVELQPDDMITDDHGEKYVEQGLRKAYVEALNRALSKLHQGTTNHNRR